jgi:hypothetical protein
MRSEHAMTDKIVFDENIACGHCGKQNHVKKIRHIKTPAQKADYEEEIIVEKSNQTTLDGADEE